MSKDWTLMFSGYLRIYQKIALVKALVNVLVKALVNVLVKALVKTLVKTLVIRSGVMVKRTHHHHHHCHDYHNDRHHHHHHDWQVDATRHQH